MKQMSYAVVFLPAAGCSTSGTPTTGPPTVTAAPPTTTAAPSASGQPTACTDDQLDVTNAPLESAGTLRRVVVTFRNTSSHDCTLTGYPAADLVTPAGGVLINVARLPANAAHHLTLAPNDSATADVQSVLRRRHQDRRRLPALRDTGGYAAERFPAAHASGGPADLRCDREFRRLRNPAGKVRVDLCEVPHSTAGSVRTGEP